MAQLGRLLTILRGSVGAIALAERIDLVQNEAMRSEIQPMSDSIVTITPTGQIELPSELAAQLHPGDEYKVEVTEGAIVLHKVENKVEKPKVDLDQFFRRLEAAPPDPDHPTVEEICEIVREVRRELWEQRQQQQ